VWDRACVDMATLVGRVLDGEGVEGVEGMVVHVGDRETYVFPSLFFPLSFLLCFFSFVGSYTQSKKKERTRN